MDVINENSAQNIGRNHQAVTNNIAKMMGLAAVKFLESLAHRLNSRLTKVVEVKINDKLVFRGEAGQKPQINKFTPEHIKLLESLLPTSKMRAHEKSPDTSRSLTQAVAANHLSPQMLEYFNTVVSNAKARLEPEKINEVQISVGGQTVYHSKDGNDFVNFLEKAEAACEFNQAQLKQNVNHLSIIASANRILEAKGVDKIEDKSYSIERSNNNLVITAKDGRGEIAKVDSLGQVSGKDLLPGETKVFSLAANKVELQLDSASIFTQATQKVDQVVSPVEESEQVKTATKIKSQVVTTTKSQPDEELEI